eukprot:4836909-Prymnesium_polylepis.1
MSAARSIARRGPASCAPRRSLSDHTPFALGAHLSVFCDSTAARALFVTGGGGSGGARRGGGEAKSRRRERSSSAVIGDGGRRQARRVPRATT